MTSAWRRRLVVAALQVAAIALFVGYFASVRPGIEVGETTVSSLVTSLKERPSGDTAVALEKQYADYRNTAGLGTALLIGAFFLGVAATVTGGIWGLVEQRRLGVAVQAATKA